MPTYEYICNDCGSRFEYFQSMSSSPLSHHPKCKENGTDVERLISGGTGLIFKGSGFYLTDYKNKKKNPKIDNGKKDNSSVKSKKKSKTNKNKKRESIT